MKIDRLSRYHTLAELLHSDTAREHRIDNNPPPELRPNLERLAQGLDQVRELLGHPLEISSGYRSPELNAAVGGTGTSQHCQGLACDFVCPAFGAPLEIAQAIGASDIEFDQCILEYGRWVHLSFSSTPRRRTLTIYSSSEGYLEGLYDTDRTRIA